MTTRRPHRLPNLHVLHRHLACAVLALGLGLAPMTAGHAAGVSAAVGQTAPLPGVRSNGGVLALVGRGEEAAVRLYGEPEQVTEYETIYNLAGQRPLRWMLYQREALFIGVDKAGKIAALLLLPSFDEPLPGGLRLEMTRTRVTQLMGRPDHTIDEEAGTRRLIYVRQAFDLTFDRRSDTLVQVLYYPTLRQLAAQLSRQAVASPRPTPTPVATVTRRATPSPKPTPTPTSRPTPKPTPTPTPRPTPTPTPKPKPTPRPTPTPTPKPTPRPSSSPRSALKARTLPPVSTFVGKAGSASVVGLVSYFRTDSGEIQYLHGVQFYVATEPLDPGLAAGARPVPRAQWEVLKLRHRARIWDLIRNGKIVSGIESDRFGRFRFQALPEGAFHLIGIFEDGGRYMVWQRPLTLAPNRQFRTYLNRNNVSLSSQ